MRTVWLVLTVALAALPASADWMRQRWAAPDTAATFPDAMTVADGREAVVLTFDLGKLPRTAKVGHASLRLFKRGSAQPIEPIRITAKGAEKPLALEPPLYRSFDATGAVRAAAGGTLVLTVRKFRDFEARRSCLEIAHDAGSAARKIEQVTGLRAIHHDGQTFLVWKEAAAYRPDAADIVWVEKWSENGNQLAKGPGAGWMDTPRSPAILIRTLRKMQGLKPQSVGRGVKYVRTHTPPEIAYRVYRHTKRITAANVLDAERVAEIAPLSGYDMKMRIVSFKGEYLDQQEVDTSTIPTYCIEDGRAVVPGEAIYVHTPAKTGRRFYAVTMVVAGTEALGAVSDANSLAVGVFEAVAEPKPVFQRMQEDRYHLDVPERWYLFWAAPPYANRQNVPLHVAASMSSKMKTPAPMNFFSFAGGFNMIGTIALPSRTAIYLAAEQQVSWFDDLGYNEGRGTLRSYRRCKVDYFSERYLQRVLAWAFATWKVDRSRVVGGPLHFGIRHPEIFGKLQFGSYTVAYDFKWAPPSNSMKWHLGPREITRTTDGHAAWDIFNIDWYLKTYPARDIPYLVCISGTGKDSGHTSEFGWQDDPRGWRALHDAHQTFVATWTCGPPREHGEMIANMRWDRCLPAFSNCSLDDNPGSGDPADGDPFGTLNGWLLWRYDDQVDTPDEWAMTVYLAAVCPEAACTVNLTPRHVTRFKAKAGATVRWTNTDVKTGKVVQHGTATADKHGLLTIENLRVTKDRNRIALSK